MNAKIGKVNAVYVYAAGIFMMWPEKFNQIIKLNLD